MIISVSIPATHVSTSDADGFASRTARRCLISMSERALHGRSSFQFSLKKLLFVLGIVLLASMTALSQDRHEGPRIEFIERVVSEAQDSIKIPFKIRGASNKRVRVRVDSAVDGVVSSEITLSNKSEHVLLVNLFGGDNRIAFIVFVNDEPQTVWNDSIKVFCSGRWCKKPFTMPSDSVAEELGDLDEEEPPKKKQVKAGKAKDNDSKPEDAEDEPNDEDAEVGESKTKDGKQKGSIKILVPEQTNVVYQDATVIPLTVEVKKRKNGNKKNGPELKQIAKVFVRVLNGGKPIEQEKYNWEVEFPDGEDSAKLNPMVRIGKDTNTITVFDADKPLAEADQDSRDVTCEGEKCGSDPAVSTIVTNSLNTRAVVGLEQVGASSADSEMKPFLDFFFTAPIRFTPKTAELPRVSTWGQIRLSATPQQAAAIGVFPSNLSNQVATASNSTGLVQSFDFLAGFEARAFGANKFSTSLVPGVKQRTAFYFTAGGGAISPLSTTRQSAQIWKVPAEDSSQRAVFVERFGEAAGKKSYIAFVLPERDRFLRQFYAGIRLKTFFYDRNEQLINRFPGILDVMFGQNEAVTGGSLKHDVKDSNGETIGRRRSYVMRLDGFYPLPFKEASFLYLYGTAMLKLGNGGVRVSTPLFLDPAPEISVTNKDVFIQRAVQDQDYYKIGVGINLTELFNRKPATPK